jgi:hypothetical protein
MSGVIYCKAENGAFYWVKGHNVGREDQIKEWLCGHLAKEFGLPVAPFRLASIDEDLVRSSTAQFRHIGYGPVFASKDVGQGTMWYDYGTQGSDELKRDILLFDYWIQNPDRQTHNTNLLWDAVKDSVVVIDHNLAFWTEDNDSKIVADHLFTGIDRTPFRDLVTRISLIERMDRAMSSMDSVIAHIPAEWAWYDLEETRKVDLELLIKQIPSILNRYRKNDDFWKVL